MYVVSYDISSDKIRNKAAKILEGYGIRIQYSVFECRITEKEYEELCRKLIDLMGNRKEGNIRFYSLCRNCEKKIFAVGQVAEQYEKIKEKIIVI